MKALAFWVCFFSIGVICSVTCWSITVYVAFDATGDDSGADWQNACTTISAGLTTSASGDEIWVKAGRYNEAITLKQGVALYGGFPAMGSPEWEERDWAANETIIDATSIGNTTVRGAGDATLDGFTVSGGSASNGGGVYCASSSPTLANCTITGNSALAGGAVYCSSSSPVLTNCTIMGNSGYDGGGVCCEEASPTLMNCIVTENEAIGHGAGVFCSHYSYPTLTNCAITSNVAHEEGGGMYCGYYSSPILDSCALGANTAKGGGGIMCYYQSRPSLVNCAITVNSATGDGGGVFCNYSSPMFANCTISANMAQDGDGNALWTHNSSPSFNNCILRNSGDEIYVSSDSATVSYSCVEGGYQGTGNIDADPQFVHPWDGEWADLHLLPSSPCIDAGGHVQDVTQDFDGLSRPFDGTAELRGDGSDYDMGAYEYHAGYETATPTATATSTPLVMNRHRW